MHESRPKIVVFSSLFPRSAAPLAGLFIRERMFRVGMQLHITVVSPQPWFPFQRLIRCWSPHYRPTAPAKSMHGEIEILHPRFLSVPGLFRKHDGFMMAFCTWFTIARLKRQRRADIIDAHFGYPDGYAATLLGRWLRLPVTITLRGTEIPHAANPRVRSRLIAALTNADRLFSVSASLCAHAIGLGIPKEKIKVIGNAVDSQKFRPEDRSTARARLGIPRDAHVLISVGGLIERKGFHRVLDVLPSLRGSFPELHYLIVGGGGPAGDMGAELREQARNLGLQDCVHFLGALPPQELRWPLSAANVFVLATRSEGWANVFLEAMACGLPVITTDVGGNSEVVCSEEYGTIVPFGDQQRLEMEMHRALLRQWDHMAIRNYACANSWDKRVETLIQEFREIAAKSNRRTNQCAWPE